MKPYLKEWLIENGGPSILLHIERDRNKDKMFENGLISKLLEIEDIKKLMSCMDQFIPQPRENKALEHLLHYYKETCIDHFFPRLMETGFRAGIPEWDEKMKPFRELYSCSQGN